MNQELRSSICLLQFLHWTGSQPKNEGKQCPDEDEQHSHKCDVCQSITTYSHKPYNIKIHNVKVPLCLGDFCLIGFVFTLGQVPLLESGEDAMIDCETQADEDANDGDNDAD